MRKFVDENQDSPQVGMFDDRENKITMKRKKVSAPEKFKLDDSVIMALTGKLVLKLHFPNSSITLFLYSQKLNVC